ncbi:MAG: DUF5018 domain-containing protein [Sporocytophaga sp.]|nr:DUF5018 domain-containing protein [Sporocytophaga sp.]
MKNIKISILFISIFTIIVLNSCKKDSNNPGPSQREAKSILSFKFSDLASEVSGIISETDKKIKVKVPKGTNITNLTPTITISEKASIQPSSGISQNFTTPVEYVVIAEDGSSQKYEVTVEIELNTSFTLNPIANTSVQQDGNLLLSGNNFGSPSNIKVVLRNVQSGEETEIKAASWSTSEVLFFHIPEDLPLGKYAAKLFIGNESLETDTNIEVFVHTHEISSVSKTLVKPDDTIIIKGKYFASKDNIVQVLKDGHFYNLEILSETSTAIEVKFSGNMPSGEFTLCVISNKTQIRYSSSITYTL